MRSAVEIEKELMECRRELNLAETTANSLKVTINGSFGKLGSKYSKLYAPNLMVQVTVTGQLSLLMLIMYLNSKGIPVVSANTDGVVIKCPKDKESLMVQIIKIWEDQTGFEMERSDYASLHSRDINNYLAVKHDGKVKTKGCFAGAGLQKNPTNEICNEAIAAYLTKGIPVEDTIKSCTDIRKFLTIRTVKGGAARPLETMSIDDWYEEVPDSREWVRNKIEGDHIIDGGPFKAKRKSRPPEVTITTDFTYLGKAIRWYYGKVQGHLIYRSTGNKVPRSEGAVACLDLPDHFPTDLNYQWYIEECNEMLKNVGIGK